MSILHSLDQMGCVTTFATKKDGNVGGAGGKNDYEYNIVWSIKEAFESKLAEIKSIFKI